jgi:hypothetical protein
VTQSVHQNAGSIGQTLTTSMISRLNVNAGFDSGEICDRFRLEGSNPRDGNSDLENENVQQGDYPRGRRPRKPTNYHLRIQADICRLHFSLAVGPWGLGDYF